jgi:hypothetical protein
MAGSTAEFHGQPGKTAKFESASRHQDAGFVAMTIACLALRNLTYFSRTTPVVIWRCTATTQFDQITDFHSEELP